LPYRDYNDFRRDRMSGPCSRSKTDIASYEMTALYEIAQQTAVYNERIAIVLGIMTLGLAILVFASCRTCVQLLERINVRVAARSAGYRAFARYHMYYWWFFGVSALAHAAMAVGHTGLPQPGDPDAGIHWVILILGITGALFAVGLFSSCRISPKVLAPTLPKLSLTNRTYLSFVRLHTLFWLPFALLVAAHFAVGYFHAGLWPKPG